MLRAGLRKLLEVDPEINVVAEAADGLEAIAAAQRLRPDVVLMDIRMPRLDGLEATRRLGEAKTETRVLILTTFGLSEYVYEALRAGASGFLLKDAPAEDLLAAVRIVARGDALLDPSITRAVIAEYTARPERRHDLAAQLEQLTPRELDVFKLLARGHSNAEIASDLVISNGTAKTHVARILLKLQLRDRVQGVIFAYESGLVELGPIDRDRKTQADTG